MGTLRPGRITSPKKILGVRELELTDLEQFLKPREKRPVTQRFRDTHHRLARLFATGLKSSEVAAQSGYSITRVSMLHADPAFQELIANYRRIVTDGMKETASAAHELMTANMLTAQRMIADQLEQADEENEKVPLKTLVAISSDAADRVGYGKKNTTVNVNVDFASRLEQRRSRQRELELKAIKSITPHPLRTAPSSVGSASSQPPHQLALPPIRRRV